jgi:hypothetical protein
MLFTGFRPSSLSGIIFPILLIIMGIYLILTRTGLLGSRKIASPPVSETLPPED